MDKAVAEMWEQVSAGLRAFIGKRVRDQAETEDLLQEIFLRVHRHIEGLHDPERMVSWVYQITRHAIIDHYRSAERRRELPAGLAIDWEADKEASRTDAEEAEGKYELSSCLRPMMERLSLEYREAIMLVELEGLTHQEAAERLGLSVPGMKSRVQRGRRQLRKMLEDCCLIQLDRRGGVAEYHQRDPGAC